MVLLVTIIATLGLGCRTVPLQGERKEEKGAEVDIPEIEYEEFTLDNGLRVIVH